MPVGSLVAWVAFLSAFVVVAPAQACSCRRGSVDEWIRGADEAFEGIVVELQAPNPSTEHHLPTAHIVVQVTRVFRGDIGDRVTIAVDVGSSCATTPPPIGSTWLFFGRSVDWCSHVYQVGTDTWRHAVALLGGGDAHVVHTPPRVTGGCGHCSMGRHADSDVLGGAIGGALMVLIVRRRRGGSLG